MRRAPEDALPLTEPEFHILLALVAEALHGYGIILAVEEATSGRLRLRTGTLYTALRRMESRGLIEEAEQRPHPREDDARRRYYRVTAYGRSVARAEAARVESMAVLARSRGLLAKPARKST